MRNRLLPAAVAMAFLALSGGASLAANYADMDCDDLWQARNQIYADAGFCFKTERAIDEFGKGCFPPYGKLSHYEAKQVQKIQYWESQNDCN